MSSPLGFIKNGLLNILSDLNVLKDDVFWVADKLLELQAIEITKLYFYT